ncbi:hypothetical protein ACSBR2_038203 [Camellia fascicularis]
MNLSNLQLSDGDDEWDRTSHGKSITYFRSSFLQPLLRSCKEEIESSHSAKLRESKNSLIGKLYFVIIDLVSDVFILVFHDCSIRCK